MFFHWRFLFRSRLFAQSSKGIELYNQWKFADSGKGTARSPEGPDPSETQANYYLGLSVLMQEKYNEAINIFVNVKRSQDKADQTDPPGSSQ